MRRAWKTLNALSLAYSGAYILLGYLHWKLDPSVAEVEWLWSNALLGLMIITTLTSFFRPRDMAPVSLEISPALSGSIVVLATGLAATVALGWGFSRAGDLLVPLLVAVLTLAIAWLVFRYASGKADEIGEARFVEPRRDGAVE